MSRIDRRDAVFAAERAAWAVVNRRLPGQQGHDAKAWEVWVNAARTANELADGVQERFVDAQQPPKRELVTAFDDKEAIALSEGLQQVAEHFSAALRELLTRARSGDVEAFEAFYDATAHWLLRQVRSLVIGDEQVEAALAGAYLRAWARLEEFNTADLPPQEWLLSMAIAIIRADQPTPAPAGVEVTSVAQVAALGAPTLNNGAEVARQLADSDQQLVVLVHDIRTALASARQALYALSLDHLPVDGATGEALKRSLNGIESLLGHALDEGRARPKALQTRTRRPA